MRLQFNVYSMCGTLSSVDQYLNLKLKEVTVNDGEKHPHMVNMELGILVGVEFFINSPIYSFSCRWAIVSSEVPLFDTFSCLLMRSIRNCCKMLHEMKPIKTFPDKWKTHWCFRIGPKVQGQLISSVSIFTQLRRIDHWGRKVRSFASKRFEFSNLQHEESTTSMRLY